MPRFTHIFKNDYSPTDPSNGKKVYIESESDIFIKCIDEDGARLEAYRIELTEFHDPMSALHPFALTGEREPGWTLRDEHDAYEGLRKRQNALLTLIFREFGEEKGTSMILAAYDEIKS